MTKLNMICPVCSEDDWDVARYNPLIEWHGEYDQVCKNCGLYHTGKGYDLTTWQNDERFDESEFDLKRFKRIKKLYNGYPNSRSR